MSSAGFLDRLFEQARHQPDGVFARFAGEQITIGALAQMADGVACGLRRRGIGRGERVAVMLRNGPAALAAIFGLARAGAVWVPLNVQLRGPGLRYQLEHSDPALILSEPDLLPVIAGSEARLPETVGADRELAGWMVSGEVFDEPFPDPEECLAIFYTSGTTGSPKGVMLSHAMLRYAGEAVALMTAPRPGDTYLMWEPLYHIGGAQMLVVPLIREASLAMVERFSASRFWQQAHECGASHIHFLGGILQLLLKQPPGPLDRAHGVRLAWGGGCPADIWPEFEERFGVEIREAYGMTEASSITTYNDRHVVGSVGRPVPWFEVALRDAVGASVPAGADGEIVVRANEPAALFPGYFRDPDATAKALRHGELWTGDRGRYDAEGNLYFLGRMTESVRVRGENISAWEVERVAASYPDIEDCAVIGVAAEIGEQEIKLFVQPKLGTAIDLAALSRWLGERLAAYQNPRYIALVEHFERTPSQRVAKRALSRDIDGCWDRVRGTNKENVEGNRK